MNMHDSKLTILDGDTNRTATVTITCEGHSAERPIPLDAMKYHGLLSGLRLAIDHVSDRIANEKFPAVNKERVDLWKAQCDELIEVLCCFDI